MHSIELRETADGSFTFYNPAFSENYHSKHGALQESEHVFLNSGLKYFLEHYPCTEVRIFEVGFGTGLNFLLAAKHCIESTIKLHYKAVELYPLTKAQLELSKYQQYVPSDLWDAYIEQYDQALSTNTELINNVHLEICNGDLLNINPDDFNADIVYYDAFAAVHQPEMWSFASLEKARLFMKDKGIFVTYSVTGNLKRNLVNLGFRIERPVGANGKREMMRAFLNL
jgi:tRNA U34 5-methylaminomethyl-2-thiouridine-forming methyltransferase MnmC